MKTIGTLLMMTSALSVASGAEVRTWTDVTGQFTVQAELVETTNQGVTLLRTNGKTLVMPLDKLSAEDRQYLENLDVQANSNNADSPEAVLEAAIRKRIHITIEPIDSAAIATVFSGRPYKATMLFKELGGHSSSQSWTMMLAEGKDLDIEDPHTDMPMPNLAKAVKSGFVLKTQAEAKKFLAALDVAYKPRRDVPEKRIEQDGKKWRFIRGKFFKKRMGFIVATDADGKVTGSIIRWGLNDCWRISIVDIAARQGPIP
jgi:hypothetical protein